MKLNDEQLKIKEFLINAMPTYLEIDEILLNKTAVAVFHLNNMNDKLNDNAYCCYEDRQFMASRDKFVKEVEQCLKQLDITPQQRNRSDKETAKTTDVLSDILGDI